MNQISKIHCNLTLNFRDKFERWTKRLNLWDVFRVLLQELTMLRSCCPVLCILGSPLVGRVGVGLATETRQALNWECSVAFVRSMSLSNGPVLSVWGVQFSGRVSVGLATDTKQALNSGV